MNILEAPPFFSGAGKKIDEYLKYSVAFSVISFQLVMYMDIYSSALLHLQSIDVSVHVTSDEKVCYLSCFDLIYS